MKRASKSASQALPGRIRIERLKRGGSIGDLTVIDVIRLQPAGIGAVQEHVAFAGAAEIADPGELPIQADCAQ
jgi:hypothetical protein